jgi:hypothetical protein
MYIGYESKILIFFTYTCHYIFEYIPMDLKNMICATFLFVFVFIMEIKIS